MNTAIQELIKELEKFKSFPMVDKSTIEAAIDFAKLRLDDEKKQIEEAWWNGHDTRGECGFVHVPETIAEEYYLLTFNT